jgi:hypothetical protein
LTIARLLAVSEGELTLSQEHFERARSLESERLKRVEKL